TVCHSPDIILFVSTRFTMARFLSLLALVCFLPWAAAAPLQPSAASKTPPILVEVDASEAPRKLYHVRLVIPAAPGAITLYYPKWIPGTHGPTGPIADLAGLKLQAGGKAVPWKRDDIDMYAFHC